MSPLTTENERRGRITRVGLLLSQLPDPNDNKETFFFVISCTF